MLKSLDSGEVGGVSEGGASVFASVGVFFGLLLSIIRAIATTTITTANIAK